MTLDGEKLLRVIVGGISRTPGKSPGSLSQAHGPLLVSDPQRQDEVTPEERPSVVFPQDEGRGRVLGRV